MQITIIGTGYVGLVTGACFAEMGHSVMCLDVNISKVEKLKRGEIPIYEPGLEELVKRNAMSHRLLFTNDYEKAVSFGEICFIAVPTPSKEDGSCNIEYVESVARHIGQTITSKKIIVNKSTVPVGTAQRVETILSEELSKRGLTLEFHVVSNPEFLKEGAAVQDCLKPDRIIIGAKSLDAANALREVYSPFTISHDKILIMDPLSAEMAKYAANAMLATRISFMNEMAEICKRTGANVNEVRKGIGSDSRIGYNFLYPGIGYGGSCFPKDIRALIAKAKEFGYAPKVLEAVDAVNIRQKKLLGQQISHYFSKNGGLAKKTIAVWGLSFKPDTDDIREAPSLIFIKEMLERGAKLKLFDPVAMSSVRKIFKNNAQITWCENEFEAVKDADAVALLTEWKQFRLVNFDAIRKEMKGKAFFDGRNQYKPLEMKTRGFDYISIGVPDQLQGVS